MIGPDDIRRLALSLPEAHEAPHFDSTSFRVKGKIFATLGPAAGLVLKLDPEDQHNLAEGRPDAISAVDGYWGRNGWTRVQAEELAAEELLGFLRMAWLNVAPKRLAKTFLEDLNNAG